ncbi:MAG: hypothetical protein ACI8UZ_001820 [Akkermansiaceae bacterium]|jgi:hypothetical protein
MAGSPARPLNLQQNYGQFRVTICCLVQGIPSPDTLAVTHTFFMKLKFIPTFLLPVALSFLSASFSNAELIDGLVEHWALDGDYSAAVDSSHDGTLATTGTGSAAFVAGKFGSAVDFTSSTDNQAIVTIGGDENDFDFTASDFSISAWYTTESLYTNWQTIIAKGEGNGWRIARASASGTSLTFSSRKPHNYPANLDLQDGSWHLLVSTVESGVETNMYIDGVLVATDTTGYVPQDRGNPMQISGNPDAANRGWNGNIDDVGAWNRVLTQEEVSSIWNDGNGASIASLTGGTPTPLRIVDVAHTRTVDNILVDLTFTSKEGSSYSIYSTNDLSLPLTSWNELNDGFPAAVEALSTIFPADFNDLGLALDDHQFFVVVKNP